MVFVAVTGAAGRMGRAIVTAVHEDPGTTLMGALEREESPFVGADAGEVAGVGKTGVKITDDRATAFSKADAIIDFTATEATMKTLEEASALGKGVVVGTTGFSHHQRDQIKELAAGAKVVMAPNMSIGVNLLLKLVQSAASVLGPDYDIEVVECHHRHKKDAPSGTALRIAEVAASARGQELDEVAVYDRKGIIGERKAGEIGIQTLRAGDVVGDHTIMFATMGERIELVHKASSRQTFAKGAVKAALWLADRPNGLYDMQDVLGLKD